MKWVPKAIQVAYGNRPDPLVSQFSDKAADEIFVQRLQHFAIGHDPLRHVKAQVAWDKGSGQFQVQVVQLIAVLPANLQRIAETAGSE